MSFHLLHYIFPRFCVGCGKVGAYVCYNCEELLISIPLENGICPMCYRHSIDGLTHLRCRTPYTLDNLISFYRYKGLVSKLIKEIKYRYSYDMVEDLASYIPRKTLHKFSMINRYNSVIIPMPLHPIRYKFRGFNQSEMFAQYFADRMLLPIYTDVLIRAKHTRPQAMIEDRKMRRNNMKDAFDIREMCKDTNILLIDDVFTTGATMKEACKVLKKAGAKWVCGVTIAR